FSLLIHPPSRSTLFPYTTLFRSHCQDSLPKYIPSYSKSIPWPDSGSGNEPPKAFEASKGAQIFVQTLCLKVPSGFCARAGLTSRDRKSTRLNSSHLVISYAVFCL